MEEFKNDITIAQTLDGLFKERIALEELLKGDFYSSHITIKDGAKTALATLLAIESLEPLLPFFTMNKEAEGDYARLLLDCTEATGKVVNEIAKTLNIHLKMTTNDWFFARLEVAVAKMIVHFHKTENLQIADAANKAINICLSIPQERVQEKVDELDKGKFSQASLFDDNSEETKESEQKEDIETASLTDDEQDTTETINPLDHAKDGEDEWDWFGNEFDDTEWQWNGKEQKGDDKTASSKEEEEVEYYVSAINCGIIMPQVVKSHMDVYMTMKQFDYFRDIEKDASSAIKHILFSINDIVKRVTNEHHAKAVKENLLSEIFNSATMLFTQAWKDEYNRIYDYLGTLSSDKREAILEKYKESGFKISRLLKDYDGLLYRYKSSLFSLIF